VPRFQLVIIERPAVSCSFGMDDRLKVLRAISEEDSAIELRISADIVIVAGVEAIANAVDPELLRSEDPTQEDGAGVPRSRRVLKPCAPFENDNIGTGGSKSGSACRAAHARSHNQDVNRLYVGDERVQLTFTFNRSLVGMRDVGVKSAAWSAGRKAPPCRD